MNLSQGLLLLLVTLLLLLSIAFVLPFLEFFLLAILLAYLLLPVQKWLEKRVRPKVASTIIVTIAAVTVILPLVYVVRRTASDAVAIVESIRTDTDRFGGIEQSIQEVTGMSVDISSLLETALSGVQFDSVLSVFGALTHLLIGVGLTIFLLYYFLKDRNHFLSWLYQTVPLTDDVQKRLYGEIDHILKAVLVGHVFVAFIQGLLAGIGLLVVGIPNAMFWTIVMVVLSLLPVVGSFLVWGPAVVYLLANGQTGLAIALFLWGTIVVGISDDYLRPVVVDRYAQVNPSVIIIGVIGGIYVIGFMGIFFGPVAIGTLRATLDVYSDEYGTTG